jgi:2-polyprenyl-3-methyl-5-hydroxy-6-metoxy-1,4-benzoquinol methylase
MRLGLPSAGGARRAAIRTIGRLRGGVRLAVDAFPQVTARFQHGHDHLARPATRCLGGSLSIVRSRTVLEAGCGAGRFTEILLEAGARVVAADLSAAVDANYENCGTAEEYFVCQADIRRLPVAPRSFDVVLCLGVVQHTPQPEETIEALATYVAAGGLLVIDHYSRDYPATMPRRVLRDLLLRMPPERARRVALGTARALLPVHRALWQRRRGFGRLRRYLGRVSPVVDYYEAYPELGTKLLSEWAVLDTHDTLTDRYKHLRGPDEIRETLMRLGLADIEVNVGGNGVEARARATTGRDARTSSMPRSVADVRHLRLHRTAR